MTKSTIQILAEAILNADNPVFTWEELDSAPYFVPAAALKRDARKKAKASLTALATAPLDEDSLHMAAATLASIEDVKLGVVETANRVIKAYLHALGGQRE